MFNQLRNIQQPAPRNPNSSGAIVMPEIATAFQNDPRTRLAAAMIQNGSSTAPVAGGKWAWADGIARALSGVGGGLVTRNRQRSFERDQQTAMADMARALDQTDEARLTRMQRPVGMELQPGLMEPPQGGPDPSALVQPLPQLGPPEQAAPTPEELAKALGGQPPQGRVPAAPGRPQAGLAPLVPQSAMIPPGARQGGVQVAVPMRSTAPGGGRSRFPNPSVGAIVDLGTRLQQGGFIVGENRYVGSTGFHPNEHRTREAHGQTMIDVNIPGFHGNVMNMNDPRHEANDPQARARMDAQVLAAQAQGYRVLWNRNVYNPYGRGPSHPIGVRSPRDNNAARQHVNHAHFEAPGGFSRQGGNGRGLQGMAGQAQSMFGPTVDGILQGNVPGAAPQGGGGVPPVTGGGNSAVPNMHTEAPFTPQPVQQITTPEPNLPDRPQAPQLPDVPRSERGQYARALMATGNPYLMQRAQEMLNEGMGEDFVAEREGVNRAFEQSQTGYTSDLGNFTNAQSQNRGAVYDARQAERGQGFTQDNMNRQFGFQHDERVGQQGWQSGERMAGQTFQGAENDEQRGWQSGENAAQRTWQSGENEGDRGVQRYVADQRRAQAADRRSNFFATPQGARMYEAYTTRVSQNDTVMNGIQQFMALNAEATTGGAANNIPLISDVNRVGRPRIQQMEAITSMLAPMLRQAGSGAMSDRDLANFRRSIPNVQNTAAANRQIGERLVRGYRRMQEYEGARLNAIAEGDVITFERGWRAYVNSTSIDTDTTFEQWQASVPRYNAAGERLQ